MQAGTNGEGTNDHPFTQMMSCSMPALFAAGSVGGSAKLHTPLDVKLMKSSSSKPQPVRLTQVSMNCHMGTSSSGVIVSASVDPTSAHGHTSLSLSRQWSASAWALTRESKPTGQDEHFSSVAWSATYASRCLQCASAQTLVQADLEP